MAMYKLNQIHSWWGTAPELLDQSRLGFVRLFLHQVG